MDIIKEIKTKYGNLSKKQKSIADYLLKNENEIGFKTLKEVSVEVGATEVTIINFCKKIGLQNFTDLKLQFQDLILKKTSPTQKLFKNIQKESMKNDLFRKIMDMQLNNHQSTMVRLSEDDLKHVVKLIDNSKKIYVFCEGLSQFVGLYLENRLERLGIDVEVIDSSSISTSFMFKTLRFSKDHLFIAITYPNYSEIVLKLSEYVKGKEFNLIGITDKESSPLKEYSDVLFCSENDSLVFYNSIHSAISIVEIIATILSNYCQDKLSMIVDEIEEIESIFEEFIDN